MAKARPKTCKKCGEEKPISHFYRRRAEPDGHHAWCKACVEAARKKVDLSPDGYTWNSTPQPKPGPDGIYPCAMPGVTKAF